MKKAASIALVAIALAGVACVHPGARQCSKWVEFFHQPMEEQQRQFLGFELARQYEVYTCGMSYIHPPLMGYSELLARKGAEAVPFLRAKLSEAKDDQDIYNVSLVFAAMQRLSYYDVKSDRDVLADLEARITRMQTPELRDSVTRHLERIKSPSAP